MFLTQIYGTILGGFVNYAVMISIIRGNRELLADGNGNNTWSGANMQSYNTNAISWALAGYLFTSGSRYQLVPVGLGIGTILVAIHRIFSYVGSSHRPLYINLSSSSSLTLNALSSCLRFVASRPTS